jgi:hypothetical protein
VAELDQGGDVGPTVRPTDRRHERRDRIQVRHRQWRQRDLKVVRGSRR